MKRIIKDLTKLAVPSEPLEFITPNGLDKVEGDEIIAALKEVLEKHKDISAVAAPQIGFKKRIFCIKFNDTIKTFINPIITKKSKGSILPETFSSMPGKEILIARPDELTVVYYTDDYKYEDNKLLGPAARVFDQMAQLLDGITPDSFGLVSDIAEDGSIFDCTEDEFKQLVEMYKTYAKTMHAGLMTEINADEDVSKQYKKLKFTEDVITGDAAVVAEQPKRNRAQRRADAKYAKQINKMNRK